MKLWFLTIRNWAATDEPGDSELSDIVLPLPPDEALSLVEHVASGLPRWRVESSDRTAGTVHLTRGTRVFGFVDDVRLTLEAVAGGTRLRGRSQSRIGFTDLGQNRRNLRQLVAALRAAGHG